MGCSDPKRLLTDFEASGEMLIMENASTGSRASLALSLYECYMFLPTLMVIPMAKNIITSFPSSCRSRIKVDESR